MISIKKEWTDTPPGPLACTLPIRRLVEFLLRTGSLDSRFTGFDRANEGARLHRKLQRAAQKEFADYTAEVPLTQQYGCDGVEYTLEGRADGIFTGPDGVPTIDEIKTTLLPSAEITGKQSPEHWAQAKIYAAIYSKQNGVSPIRVRLDYYQVEEEKEYRFVEEYTAGELEDYVRELLTRYAPWAKRAAHWQHARRVGLEALTFPFAEYRAGQRAMAGAVYRTCCEGGALLCQAPTGIGKTMSVLFPALKALGDGGPIFYLTARGTTRTAAENALDLLRLHAPGLALRSITLTAKDKICPQPVRECTPDACPYANGYFDRIKAALWNGLDTPALTADALQALARQYQVCPFELGLDLSLWCDVVVGDYNYLFDPVVRLARFFDTRGDYLFLIDEAHNLPGRARDMHSASLCKSAFLDARKRLGPGKALCKRSTPCFWTGGAAARKHRETAASAGLFLKRTAPKNWTAASPACASRCRTGWTSTGNQARPATRCCSFILTCAPGCGSPTPLTTISSCRSPPAAARYAPPCSAWTPARSWPPIFPKDAPPFCSAPRCPRPVTTKTCAVCRTPAPLHCAAPFLRNIWGYGAPAM